MGDLIAFMSAASLWIAATGAIDTREFTSAVHDVPGGFSSAIASWNVTTPPGGWIAVQLRARIEQRWTAWYEMGHWSPSLGDGHRHSIAKQSDADGSVDTDTLNLSHPAQALQLRAQLHAASDGVLPTLRLLGVSTDDGRAASDNVAAAADVAAWGVDIDVPELTQLVGKNGGAYGGGGGSWCSPTSVAMVMRYWSQRLNKPQWVFDVPTAAKGTYDPVYDGCGNWPFNVAFASEHGLKGWIERFTSLADIERYVARRIPVIASIRTKPGELDGTPYKSTDGHLLVVRGFTAGGDVIVNDPAAQAGTIRRVYKRAQFAHVWQHGSHGAVYLIAPPSII